MGEWKNLLGARIAKRLERCKPVLEQCTRFGLKRRQRCSWLNASDDVGPLLAGIGEERSANHFIHRIHREKEAGRIRVDTIPVKSFWRNTNDCDRPAIDVKRASYHARIACVIPLPRVE